MTEQTNGYVLKPTQADSTDASLPDVEFKTRCLICGKVFVYFYGRFFYGCPPPFCRECYERERGGKTWEAKKEVRP